MNFEEQRTQKFEQVLQAVRDVRRYPKEYANRNLDEQQFTQKLRKARAAQQFSPEQEAELQALKQPRKKSEDIL